MTFRVNERLASERERDYGRSVRDLELTFLRASPWSQYQHVDVVFNDTAYGDTLISHDLKVESPDDVEFFPYSWEFTADPSEAPVVFRPTGADGREWTNTLITLRCNIASAKCKLLLTVAPKR